MVLGQLRSQTVAVVTHSRRRCTATQALRRGACRYICLGSILESLVHIRSLQIYVLFPLMNCIHKSVWSKIGCFVEFGMLVVVDENGERFHRILLFIPHLIVQLRFKSDLFPRNAVRANLRFCPLFTRTGS